MSAYPCLKCGELYYALSPRCTCAKDKRMAEKKKPHDVFDGFDSFVAVETTDARASKVKVMADDPAMCVHGRPADGLCPHCIGEEMPPTVEINGQEVQGEPIGGGPGEPSGVRFDISDMINTTGSILSRGPIGKPATLEDLVAVGEEIENGVEYVDAGPGVTVERRPTRARVAMCECGAEMRLGKSGRAYECTACECVTYGPYWGHYPPDVTGIADALHSEAEPDHGNCGDYVRVSRFWLRRLADELRGKK